MREAECIGCASCVEACNFSAIKIHPSKGIAIKCVFCGSCIYWCPVECLRIVED